MDLRSLIQHITTRIIQPLPGLEYQLSIFSEQARIDYETRINNYENENKNNVAKQSSVLILFYEKEGKLFVPLIKRASYDGVHSGQIAFPGGKVEPKDKDMIATALRESQEEIGISLTGIEILGILSPVFIPPSNFLVNVVLAYTSSVPQFTIDTFEVAELIEFPLTHLENSESIEERDVMGATSWRMKAPGYVYQEHFIWGATAMMLSELKALMKK